MRRESGSRFIHVVALLAITCAMAWPASAAALDLAAAQEETVTMLQRAIQIDTSNPPGDTTELAAYFSELLQGAGIETTLYESEPGQVHVVARLRGDGTARPILLLNHADVVAAEAAEWDYPPFEGRVVDGKLYGRGAIDMKGLAILQLQVMRLLAAQKVALKRDVIFYAAPDEEAGGARGAQWMTEQHWPEVDAEYVLSEGASGRQDTFGPGSRVYFVQTAEKGVCWLTMTARGTSRHGSRPIPDNPNLYLIRALERIVAYDTPVTLTPTVEKALRELGPIVGGAKGDLWERAGNPFILPLARRSLLADEMFNPIVRTTINVTNLQSGYKINVVPSVATASLDCRILPGETPEQLLQLLERLTHDPDLAEWEEDREKALGRPLTPEERRQVTFEWVVRGEASESSVQSSMYSLIERVLDGVDPDAPVVPMMSAGGTDMRFWRERGVQAYGFEPYLLTDEQEDSMHGKNEYLRVDDYQHALQIYYELVRRAAAGEV